MEFYHLRSFVAVAKTGNLTQAAKRLFTTPPAISAHIKALEDELSTSLFTRSHKGMLLTDKGELLLKKAQVTLDSAVELVNLAANNQHEIIGEFNLAINVSTETVKLEALIEVLHQDYPGIHLSILAQSTGKTIADIQAGLIDGGFIYGDIPNDCFGITLVTQKITTVAPITFHDNKTLTNTLTKVLTKADLCKQPWIMMGADCPFDEFLTAQLGNDLRSVLKTADDGTRLSLVKKGLGLSFMELEEALSAKEKQHVRIIKTLDFLTPLHFVIKKSRLHEPVISATLDAIKNLWQVG